VRVGAAGRDRGDDRGYGQRVGKASDWLREERRKVLGDWVAFCLGCGAARRWFEEFEAEVPDTCSQCGGELLRRCKACGAPFSSLAVVDCEECGRPLRPNELFGSKIRRAK
jgi:rRNA maturation endonuclease Nob1